MSSPTCLIVRLPPATTPRPAGAGSLLAKSSFHVPVKSGLLCARAEGDSTTPRTAASRNDLFIDPPSRDGEAYYSFGLANTARLLPTDLPAGLSDDVFTTLRSCVTGSSIAIV